MKQTKDNKPTKLQLISITYRAMYYAFRSFPVSISIAFIIDILTALMQFAQIGSLGYIINELILISGSGTMTDKLYILIGVYIVATFLPMVLRVFSEYLDIIFYRKFSDQVILERRIHVANLDIQTIEDSGFQNIHEKVREKGDWGVYSTTMDGVNIVGHIVTTIIAGVFLWRLWQNWLGAWRTIL